MAQSVAMIGSFIRRLRQSPLNPLTPPRSNL
jgi:hypothetical protein